MDTKVTALV